MRARVLGSLTSTKFVGILALARAEARGVPSSLAGTLPLALPLAEVVSLAGALPLACALPLAGVFSLADLLSWADDGTDERTEEESGWTSGRGRHSDARRLERGGAEGKGGNT